MRVNPSFNSIYFEVPTEEDQTIIAEYEHFNYFPINL